MRATGIALLVTISMLAGCATEPEPTRYELTWAAAVGALRDQGVVVTLEDPKTGVARGTREGVEVSADVRTRSDGSVVVQFHTSAKDQLLISRIVQSYDRRMGR